MTPARTASAGRASVRTDEYPSGRRAISAEIRQHTLVRLGGYSHGNVRSMAYPTVHRPMRSLQAPHATAGPVPFWRPWWRDAPRRGQWALGRPEPRRLKIARHGGSSTSRDQSIEARARLFSLIDSDGRRVAISPLCSILQNMALDPCSTKFWSIGCWVASRGPTAVLKAIPCT